MPTRLQRETVSLRPTHSHEREILVPSDFANLILKAVSTQEDVGLTEGDTVGLTEGNTVGVPVGAEVVAVTGDAVGDVVGDEVGDFVGDAVGDVVGLLGAADGDGDGLILYKRFQ